MHEYLLWKIVIIKNPFNENHNRTSQPLEESLSRVFFEQQHLNATTSVMCILWISASGKYLIFPFTQHPEILWLNRIHWNNEEAFTAPLIPRTCRSEAQARFDRGRRIAVYSIDLPSDKPCTFRVKPNRL